MAVRKRIWLNSPYHNYTDRKKYLLSASEIAQYTMYEEDNTHWNYGDFINSECITESNITIFNKQPNYLLILNQGVIEARYYVTNYTFISGDTKSDKSKFTASLLRDTLVDFKDSIKSNLFKCKRGNLPKDVYSPILVQPEGLPLNQIKVGHKQIKSWDNDAQWLTLFYSTDSQKTIEFDWENTVADYSYDEMKSDYGPLTLSVPPYSTTNSYRRNYTSLSGRYRVTFEDRGTIPIRSGYYQFDLTVTASSATVSNITRSGTFSYDNQVIPAIVNRYQGLNYTNARAIATSDINYNNTSSYTNLRNKYDQRIIIRDADQYIVSYSDSVSPSSAPSFTNVNNVLNSILTGSGGWTLSVDNHTVTMGAPTVVSNYNNAHYDLYDFKTVFNIVPQTGSLVLPVTRRLDEINLSCITIPFGDDVSIKNGTNVYSGISKYAAMSIATTGWTKLGDTILDIQLLPYCPQSQLNSINFQSTPSNQIDITSLDDSYKSPMVITSTEETLYYGLVCDQSSMDYRFPVDFSSLTPYDLKLESMIRKYRLCSQDHKQSFEFSPALNGGLSSLSISYTLRPLTTVFRICPVFDKQGLYGGNYKDARGLIWQGNFSLSQIKNEWVQYKLQNSTYQQIFNSEIQHLEVSQQTSKAQETLNYETAYANAQSNIQAQQMKAGLGLATGLLSAGVGAATGNPLAIMGGVGALAGGASAGIGIGASRDIANRNLEASKQSQSLNDAQRAADLAYKQDVWTLNNQAIQARPNTLSSNTEYSIINDSKAYIEIYEPSAEEIQFVEQYLKYHGMKIGQIGYINQFLQADGDYIEGTLYFTTGLTPVISNAINAELSRGAYIQGGLFND